MKALFTASIAGFINAFEISDIRLLENMGYEVDVLCNTDNEASASSLREKGLKPQHIAFPRSPFSFKLIKSYFQLKKHLKENRYQLIHCHTPVTSILTRIAARKLRKRGTRVLYTAHGFHFYKGGSFKSWLLYYPLEKLCSRFCDGIITINQEDFSLVQRKFKKTKAYYIPGVGRDVEKFAFSEISRASKRVELGLCEDEIMLLSVGELNANKNHKVIIEAMALCENKSFRYFIAGKGSKEYTAYLKNLVSEKGLSHCVTFLGFRKDVPQLISACDIFCFPSAREGLGLAAVEAMAAGVPLLTSDTRGVCEINENEKNGYSFKWNDCAGFASGLCALSSKDVRMSFREANIEKAKKFDIKKSREQMEKIYREILALPEKEDAFINNL